MSDRLAEWILAATENERLAFAVGIFVGLRPQRVVSSAWTVEAADAAIERLIANNNGEDK